MSDSTWRRLCALEPAATFGGACVLGVFCWTFPEMTSLNADDGLGSEVLVVTLSLVLHLFLWSAAMLPACFILHYVTTARQNAPRPRVRLAHFHLGTCLMMMLMASIALPAVLDFYLYESVRAGLCITCVVVGATYIIGANVEWFIYRRTQVHLDEVS